MSCQCNNDILWYLSILLPARVTVFTSEPVPQFCGLLLARGWCTYVQNNCLKQSSIWLQRLRQRRIDQLVKRGEAKDVCDGTVEARVSDFHLISCAMLSCMLFSCHHYHWLMQIPAWDVTRCSVAASLARPFLSATIPNAFGGRGPNCDRRGSLRKIFQGHQGREESSAFPNNSRASTTEVGGVMGSVVQTLETGPPL